MVKNLPAIQETWVWSLGWEDPLEKGRPTHSGILAWRIPWTEEPGRLQSMGSQRVGHHWATNTFTFIPMKDFSSVIQYYCKSIAISQVVLGYIPQANQAVTFQQTVLGKGDLFRGEYLENVAIRSEENKNSHVNSWRYKNMPSLPTGKPSRNQRKDTTASWKCLRHCRRRKGVGKHALASILYT